MSCSCSPPAIQTFTVPMIDVDPQLVVGTNQFGFSKTGPTGAFSWIYAEIATQGGTERIELFDQGGGNSYDNPSICASGYTFGNAAAALDSTTANAAQAAALSDVWTETPLCALDISGLTPGACYYTEMTADDGVAPLVSASTGFALTTEIDMVPSTCALDQTKAQRLCLDRMNRIAALHAKKQGHENMLCLANASQGNTDKLGDAGMGQMQTAQDCLTNDVAERVAKDTTRAMKHEAKKCLADPAQLPDWSFMGAATALASAEGECIGTVEDLFGNDLDAAVIMMDADAEGARCQRDTLFGGNKLYDVLNKEALRTLKTEFKRNAADPPLFEWELQQRVFDALRADARGRIAKETARLATRVEKACENVAPAGAFPGSCNGAADAAELASCTAASSRCRMCRAFNATNDVHEDCDLFDNGGADASCP